MGLTALAYIDDNGSRPRVAWSFRATELVAPGTAGKAADSGKAAT